MIHGAVSVAESVRTGRRSSREVGHVRTAERWKRLRWCIEAPGWTFPPDCEELGLIQSSVMTAGDCRGDKAPIFMGFVH